jgi:hypothetical protein
MTTRGLPAPRSAHAATDQSRPSWTSAQPDVGVIESGSVRSCPFSDRAAGSKPCSAPPSSAWARAGSQTAPTRGDEIRPSLAALEPERAPLGVPDGTRLRAVACGLRLAVCGLRFAVCGLRFAQDSHRRQQDPNHTSIIHRTVNVESDSDQELVRTDFRSDAPIGKPEKYSTWEFYPRKGVRVLTRARRCGKPAQRSPACVRARCVSGGGFGAGTHRIVPCRPRRICPYGGSPIFGQHSRSRRRLE